MARPKRPKWKETRLEAIFLALRSGSRRCWVFVYLKQGNDRKWPLCNLQGRQHGPKARKWISKVVLGLHFLPLLPLRPSCPFISVSLSFWFCFIFDFGFSFPFHLAGNNAKSKSNYFLGCTVAVWGLNYSNCWYSAGCNAGRAATSGSRILTWRGWHCPCSTTLVHLVHSGAQQLQSH